MEIVSREYAIANGLNRYFTGKACKRGHVSERSTSQKSCIECERERSRLRSKEPKFREYARLHQVELRKTDKNREWYKKYRSSESYKAKKRLLAMRPDQVEKANNRRGRRYQESPGIFLERNRLYKSKRFQSIPSWYEKDKCKIVYQKAKEYGMQVDHVVPLVSDVVCGLHCWHNLQLLHVSENSRKGNRMWPYMPEVM